MNTSHPRGRPRGEARYRAIADDLVRRIMKGEWALGTGLPSSRTLEREYAVTTKTMLHALDLVRRQGLLAFGPRRRPVATMGAPAHALLGETVALVFSRPLSTIVEKEPHWRGAMYRGVVDAVKQEGWPLLVLQGSRWRTESPAALNNLGLRGVLLVGCPFRGEMLKSYELLRCPVIQLDHPAKGVKLHCVAIANRAFMYQAASRLLAMGHRRIAFLRAISMPAAMAKYLALVAPDVLERTEGFEAACKKAGLERRDYPVFTIMGEAGRASIRKILKTSPPFTAIVSCDEGLAEMVYEQAPEFGLKIPRDLSLVSLSSSAPSRNWTGGRVNFTEFGRRAVSLLKGKIKTRQEVRIQPEWHEGSTMQRPSAVRLRA